MVLALCLGRCQIAIFDPLLQRIDVDRFAEILVAIGIDLAPGGVAVWSSLAVGANQLRISRH